jgi:hypothetical protein
MALVDKNSLYDLVPGEGPVGDMTSLEGPAFANPVGSSGIHPISLDNIYQSSVHNINYDPPQTDLNGFEGPTFQVDNPDVTIQPSSLINQYYSSVHNINYNPSIQDLDGLPGPTFDNGLEPLGTGIIMDTIHENSLRNSPERPNSPGAYFSTVHQLKYKDTLKDRILDPNEDYYINNLPEGLGALQG